jgi:hypothetical protein
LKTTYFLLTFGTNTIEETKLPEHAASILIKGLDKFIYFEVDEDIINFAYSYEPKYNADDGIAPATEGKKPAYSIFQSFFTNRAPASQMDTTFRSDCLIVFRVSNGYKTPLATPPAIPPAKAKRIIDEFLMTRGILNMLECGLETAFIEI